jgi:predicted RNA-binding Zn ribbon-like protein
MVTILDQFVVTCQGGDVFTFVGGRPALDLTGTVMYRHREAPAELLGSAADLGEWVRQADLVHGPVAVSRDGLTQTKELREAIYRLILGRVHHRPDSQADVDLVNAAAAGSPLGLVLDRGVLRRSGTVAQLHSTLARDALEMLGSPLINRVKECAGDDCSRLYLDSSRGATRRWCGMRQCGDKAKSADYRARRRAAPLVHDARR